MTSPAVVSMVPSFSKWCDRLGITKPGARQGVLLNSVKAQSHETVLFFLCGQDYLSNPTDLKGQAMHSLFVAQGAPFEININATARAAFAQLYAGPAVGGGGYKTGGAANFNICTKALAEAVDGFGTVFLNDMVKGVNNAASSSAISATRVSITLQDIRNHTRRFWIKEMANIGL